MKPLNSIKILVIGDIILDEYIEGNVTRISPEAPIPILDKKKEWYRLGGASNVSKNLASLGIQVVQCGRVGVDKYGDYIQSELRKNGINPFGVCGDETVPTIVKTRFICGTQQLLRVDYEDKSSIVGTEVGDAIIDFIDSELKNYDAVIVSDYNKGLIFPELAIKIGDLARKRNIICVADTHKSDWHLFKGYSCITPNLAELGQAVGKSKFESLEEIKQAASDVYSALELQYLLVTMSENGMLLLTPEKFIHIPVEPTQVIDVTGAGDTAIAVFTTFLAAGLMPEESAKIANKAASIVVGKMGTDSVTPQELIDQA